MIAVTLCPRFAARVNNIIHVVHKFAQVIVIALIMMTSKLELLELVKIIDKIYSGQYSI